jgi:hypothetical protein
LPSTLQSDREAQAVYEKRQQFERCLEAESLRYKRRIDAEALVEPKVWNTLGAAQKQSLQDQLVLANRYVAEELGRMLDRVDKPLHELMEAKGERERQAYEASLSSESDVRSCARRYEELKDTGRALERTKAELEALRERINSRETMLAIMSINPSAPEYADTVYERNRLAREFNSKSEKFDTRVASFNEQKEKFQDRCGELKISRSVRDAVCAGGSYPRFCATLNKSN